MAFPTLSSPLYGEEPCPFPHLPPFARGGPISIFYVLPSLPRPTPFTPLLTKEGLGEVTEKEPFPLPFLTNVTSFAPLPTKAHSLYSPPYEGGVGEVTEKEPFPLPFLTKAHFLYSPPYQGHSLYSPPYQGHSLYSPPYQGGVGGGMANAP